ncbi:serine/threonine-protein kinase [Actinomadura sp. DC4]|uniref:serine/threonine-protein kinase n=1 Tax=Actinomadura sp. DC4 TaxID=3055069 RepID=UPI0025AFD491|nr:serine/threonine-protein kinase [Actinomadura sp. DC4]MDN3351868.1 serine/threonine-protein kinase [Actinomadura sp. DC4]
MPENPLLAQRYRLLTEVGRGGMGTVWHARDEVLGRDVAVKEVILPHGFSDEEREIQHKRTFREARTAARLSHPGVVTVYDVVEEDGRPWIVMELIRARSLHEQIKRDGVLSPQKVAEIGRQMAGALRVAHEAGILHRDVKPSNVLVSGSRAVLTDFGIARAQSDATLTQTGMLIGSPAYIAPERARGRVAVPASDMWSLGVTMYAAVEGKSPFERPDAMASLVAVLTDEPESAPNAGPLRPVIEGLLRKNPAERLTVDQVASMLDRILAGDPEKTPVDAESPEGATRRLPSPVETMPDEPEVLAEFVEAATTPGSGESGTMAYPVRSIVIVAVVLLVLFGVFVFATFS